MNNTVALVVGVAILVGSIVISMFPGKHWYREIERENREAIEEWKRDTDRCRKAGLPPPAPPNRIVSHPW